MISWLLILKVGEAPQQPNPELSIQMQLDFQTRTTDPSKRQMI